ncbi:MAG: ribbon-helix-helix domain-containing protein [Pseudomonadota bacterium]
MSYEQRNFRAGGERYCVRLEPEFWRLVEEVATARDEPLARFVQAVDQRRARGQGLGSALRCEILRHYRSSSHSIPK